MVLILWHLLCRDVFLVATLLLTLHSWDTHCITSTQGVKSSYVDVHSVRSQGSDITTSSVCAGHVSFLMLSITLFKHPREVIRKHLPHKGSRCLACPCLSSSMSAKHHNTNATRHVSNTILHTNIRRKLINWNVTLFQGQIRVNSKFHLKFKFLTI